jgi:hypothetical protein
MYHWIIFRSACPELFYNCNNKTIKYWYHASCPSTSEEYIDINVEITCGYCKNRCTFFNTRFDCQKKCIRETFGTVQSKRAINCFTFLQMENIIDHVFHYKICQSLKRQGNEYCVDYN